MSNSSFATPSPADWRALADASLKDRDLASLVHLDADGLDVRPLYAAANAGEVVFAPRPGDADGRAWDLRVMLEGDEAVAMNALALAQLEGGAASLVIRGPVTADSDTLMQTLAGVQLELAEVALDAGLDGATAADALAVAAKGSPRAKLAFHMDPVSAFVSAGGGARPLKDYLELAGNTAARHAEAYPEAKAFLASGRVVHEAGGTAAQELGYVLANAVALTEAAGRSGLSPAQAFQRTVLGLSLDQSYFDGLAKVRALRLMWRTLTRAWDAETEAVIEARSSRRMLAARDAWPNLLRLTAAGFAGAVGGADVIVLDAFSRAAGLPDAFALRQARNTQLILMEEAHLGRVDDPAAGSWFLDTRTRDLAEAGWAVFQQIERDGGLVASVEAGSLQARVAQSREALVATYEGGNAALVGVTRYVDDNPRPVEVAPESEPPRDDPEYPCERLLPLRLAADLETGAAR
jgi:methylmalonyl-CoA mutase